MKQDLKAYTLPDGLTFIQKTKIDKFSKSMHKKCECTEKGLLTVFVSFATVPMGCDPPCGLNRKNVRGMKYGIQVYCEGLEKSK